MLLCAYPVIPIILPYKITRIGVDRNRRHCISDWVIVIDKAGYFGSGRTALDLALAVQAVCCERVSSILP
jgi:hypothetical protein